MFLRSHLLAAHRLGSLIGSHQSPVPVFRWKASAFCDADEERVGWWCSIVG